MITVAEMFELLLTACPGALPAWNEHCREWADEKGDMSYLGVAVFAHHLVDSVRAGHVDELPPAFDVIERLVTEGNEKVRELTTIGLLEDLQNIASWEPSGNRIFRPYLGPASLLAWEEIQEMWRGKSSLMDVIRAEGEAKKK